LRVETVSASATCDRLDKAMMAMSLRKMDMANLSSEAFFVS